MKLEEKFPGWIKIKDRGALVHTGEVYQSPDAGFFLRTGDLATIKNEAVIAQDLWKRKFPVPQVTEVGSLSEDLGYFIETSVGKNNFGDLFRESYQNKGFIDDLLFKQFCEVSAEFLTAQTTQANRQIDETQIRKGIQLENVLAENPDIPLSLIEKVIAKFESRTFGLPLVLTHGDFNAFNVMENGVIDFEHVFIAPAGYDVLPALFYHHFFNFPGETGKSTLIYRFTPQQISYYFSRIEAVCASQNLPSLLPFFDDFLTLKSIWALCYEKVNNTITDGFNRWHWRRNVTLYCIHSYLANKPIQVADFLKIGIDTNMSNL